MNIVLVVVPILILTLVALVSGACIMALCITMAVGPSRYERIINGVQDYVKHWEDEDDGTQDNRSS